MPLRHARHVHDFPAVDTALVDVPESDGGPSGAALRESLVQRVTDKLNAELRVEICADPTNGGGVAVALENRLAGHRFPSGASQDRRMWVELHVYEAGNEVYKSGVVPSGTAATDWPGTWILRDEALKSDGKTPAHMFWDVASLTQQTIPVSTPANPQANVTGHAYKIPSANNGIVQPDEITVTVWLEPIGLDVIDDMREAGYLDDALRSAMPRLALIAPGEADASVRQGVTFAWVRKRALDDATGYSGPNNQRCMDSTQPRFRVTPQ